jgi:regulator of protease activity HflC (stomatin/prohibitin superfamily)
MNPRLAAVLGVVLVVLFFGNRFVKTVQPGFVAVASFFGEVVDTPYEEGLHFPVNPLYAWTDFDTREKTHKESAQVPTRDQLQTKVDVSIQYAINGALAPRLLQEVGNAEAAVRVFLIPKLRSIVREQGTKIPNAEEFFQDSVRKALEVGIYQKMSEYLEPKGIDVRAVLIRDINLPAVLTKAIEAKKEREQAGERQKAELERYRTEQLQAVARAEGERKAAEEDAKKRVTLADARAYEIREINKAVASNPAYIQLQALEALKSISKDPAAKIYFLDSNSPQPLPLMNIGDPVR